MVDWNRVADLLGHIAVESEETLLDQGQRASVMELARRIRTGQRSALLADEVGMGKTRIAAALIHAVRKAGGRTAIVLPAGLGVQWQQELRRFNADDKTLLPLRSYDGFISGFSGENDAEGSARRKRSHKEWLRYRRQQRELPEEGWAAEKIVMISHSFASMQFPNRGEGPAGGWRRELLPNVARLVKGRRRNLMRSNFYSGELGHVHASRRAAQAIADAIQAHNLPRENLEGDQKWLSADEYKRKILPLIGYGLGQFDLIVVDEAHKARGADSSLSRILGPVSWEAKYPFRLGMTATPVELDSSQWIDTLERVNGRENRDEIAALSELTEWITGYVRMVRRIQTEELDEGLAGDFAAAATKFCDVLRPYVLRRDKRSDPEFSAFKERHGDYREVVDVAVSPETEGFTRDWLRRFCAAEALSLLPQDDPRLKRSRLAIAQGYGFGLTSEEEIDEQATRETDFVGQARFWMDAFSSGDADIYSHPAIVAAVRKIEDYTDAREKVLVFGKFLAPMNALTRLLDAREMLRRLRDNKHWPASGIAEHGVEAVTAAMKDPALEAPIGGIDEINAMLKHRYDEWAGNRRAELSRLHREIEGLAIQGGTAAFLSELLHHNANKEDLQIGTLLEALSDRRRVTDAPWTGDEMLDLFESLIEDLAGEEDGESRDTQRAKLELYLQDYSGREGNFARMMSGSTAPQTRRMLQAAFNRTGSWPMVLIAQSRVGREGLNLHEACRTVVLLHAEWNPAIVEQQIGRVDRKNSLWLRDWRHWSADRDGQPPRIRVHPVVVSGTYDDHNWQVLKVRWLELRAQLHGDVLRADQALPEVNDEKSASVELVRRSTPDFSPSWKLDRKSP
ncbi:DEAD/DEAH box helicase [Rhizobium laguerreae]|uniref:DEAD/DEAH box helicase n=1 Tax=Rhizobium laguerreae TaxID=1076926 RepID=UPI001C92001B|nr:DEAD/DEAH box helicase [Rhizobium laguerreae]MBY3231719.1 helicase [Rhizobium laguerreae]